MAQKRGNGEGSIRKRSNGTWEARVSVGGKQKSIYGKTKTEVREKMTALQAQVDSGEYQEPSTMTVADWLTAWQRDYWGGLQQNTKRIYSDDLRLHIIPEIGGIPLAVLTATMVQRLCNKLMEQGLSAKTVHMIHGTLHAALDKAVHLELIKRNVADLCELPKVEKQEMHPLTVESLPLFLSSCRGDEYEALFFVDVFTGMRLGEIVGLTWDCVDFERGVIRVYRQLQRARRTGGEYGFTTTKNGKQRIIQPAPQVMDKLKRVKAQQAAWRLKAGEAWDNSMNLVFTNEIGGHVSDVTVRNHFKRIMQRINLPDVRFHDLRHTFATLSIQNGTDIKTVSETLGHATVAFTLDRYGHVSNVMRQSAAARMEQLISSL